MGLGGALGSMARYGAGRLVAGGSWPWATFGVNMAGGLLMGLLLGWLASRGGSETARLFLGVGVLGGFTTFSAFSADIVLLVQRGAWALAASYALLSVVLAVTAVMAGLWLMRGGSA